MGYVLYEVWTSSKMDCLYFQVERTLREQRLFEVLKVAVIRNQLPYVSTKSGKIWPF